MDFFRLLFPEKNPLPHDKVNAANRNRAERFVKRASSQSA
jgi:hypothetical protein